MSLAESFLTAGMVSTTASSISECEALLDFFSAAITNHPIDCTEEDYTLIFSAIDNCKEFLRTSDASEAKEKFEAFHTAAMAKWARSIGMG